MSKNVANKLIKSAPFIPNEVSKIVLNLVILLSTTIITVACTSNLKQQDLDEDEGTLIIYSERDMDKNTFKVDLFVNAKYLRIADNRAQEDYILFDRKAATIFNVNEADKTIMVIKSAAVTIKPPIDIKYEVTAQPSAAIPKVQGITATHYRYNANDKHCYDVVSTEKTFMPDVVQALREYRQVLAGEHAKSVGNIPKDMLDACDLAINVFYPVKHLENGLPMREWDRRGYLKFLINYKMKYKLPPEKFNLPDGYKKYSIGE